MKALILAAGVSRRLYPHTYDTPKCLLKVGGKPIINYQLEALHQINIKEIIIIVGYHREILINHVQESFPDFDFKFIINHHFFETNTAYSLYLGRYELKTDILLMNADVVYPIELLKKLYDCKHETALAVDVKNCGQEEVKIIDGGDNKIVAIGKNLIESQCLGEFIGVAKLSEKFNLHFAESLNKLINSGGENDYFEASISSLLDIIDVRFLDVSEFPCLEVDFKEDLDSARELFKS